jgi:hypothetical protein
MKETSADGLIFIVSIYNITIIIIIAKTTGARCTEIPLFYISVYILIFNKISLFQVKIRKKK